MKTIINGHDGKREIVAAAILVDGEIHTGKRHHEILHSAPTFGGYKHGIQGFVTNDGLFVNRKAARRIAIRAGQVTETISSELTSEDLW
jgi:hypothetical protein